MRGWPRYIVTIPYIREKKQVNCLRFVICPRSPEKEQNRKTNALVYQQSLVYQWTT